MSLSSNIILILHSLTMVPSLLVTGLFLNWSYLALKNRNDITYLWLVLGLCLTWITICIFTSLYLLNDLFQINDNIYIVILMNVLRSILVISCAVLHMIGYFSLSKKSHWRFLIFGTIGFTILVWGMNSFLLK